MSEPSPITTTPVPRLEWVKPPRQARSQKTLERILDAAEALILETGATTFTVAEVARRARSSVGSLYARFNGKEALLRSVFERFLEQAEATTASVLAAERWRDAPMTTVVQATVSFAVQVFHERRLLISALMLRAVEDAEMFGVAERLSTRTADRLLVMAHERQAEIGHPDLPLAVRFVTWNILSSLEARALHHASEPVLDGAHLSTELARMCTRYLGIAEPGSDDRSAQPTTR